MVCSHGMPFATPDVLSTLTPISPLRKRPHIDSLLPLYHKESDAAEIPFAKTNKMKNKIIIAVLLICSANSFAQKFSLDELVKLSAMNVADFDAFVTAKGFFFKEDKLVSYSPQKVISKIYSINGKTAAGKKIPGEYYVAKDMVAEGDNVSTTFTSLHKEDYLAIKGQLARAGFKSWKDPNKVETDKYVHLYYKKDHTLLSFKLVKVPKNESANGVEQESFVMTISNEG